MCAQRFQEAKKITEDLAELDVQETKDHQKVWERRGRITTRAVAEAAGGAGPAVLPGIELTTAPEGYVKVHENHHLWSKARVGQWQADGQAKIVYESALIEPNPFPEGYQ